MPDPIVKLFPQDHVETIISDIQDCCQDLTRRIPTEIENNLSKRLNLKLRRISRYTEGPLEVHWESNLDDSSRVDFRFACGQGIQTYFAVEAKRLFVGSKSLTSDYINEGMMRFIDGRYAPFQQSAAMLGYVFDTTTDNAKIKLSAAIDNKRSLLNLSDHGSFSLSVIPRQSPVNKTEHNIRKREFTIYHILTKV